MERAMRPNQKQGCIGNWEPETADERQPTNRVLWSDCQEQLQITLLAGDQCKSMRPSRASLSGSSRRRCEGPEPPSPHRVCASRRQIALAKQSESHALQARRSLRCDAHRPALSAALQAVLAHLVRSPPWLALQTDRPTSLPTFSIPHCAGFSIIISSSQTAARYCFGLGCMVGYRHLCQPRWAVQVFPSPRPQMSIFGHGAPFWTQPPMRCRPPPGGTCLMPVRAHWPDADGTRRPGSRPYLSRRCAFSLFGPQKPASQQR